MRRILIVLVLAAIAAAAAWTLYQWNRPAERATDPWLAVPQQAAIVVMVPDAWTTWDRFTHTSQLWGAFEQVPAIAAAGRLMARTMERMENDAALRGALKGTPVLVALLRGGGEELGCLFVGAPPTGEAAPLTAFGELIGADAAAARALAGGGVVQTRPDSALPTLSLCVRRGLWLLASSANVMDEALLQLEGGTAITSDPVLAQAIGTLGAGTDAHVLAHTTRAQRLLNTWWTPGAIEHIDLPAGWAALDVRARPDALLMSGLLVPDGEHPLLTALRDQGTGRSSLHRLLPASVAAMDVRNILDPRRWTADRTPANDADAELADALFHWVDGTVGIATAPGNGTGATRRWALFGTGDPDAAAAALGSLCAGDVPCDTLAHRGTRLTRLPAASLHERLLGPAFAQFEKPWWAVLGDAVVMSEDPEALRAAIDAWNDGGTLAEDARTIAWFGQTSDEAGRMLWCDVARSRSLFREGLKPGSAAAFDSLNGLWQRLGGLTLQVSPGNRGFAHLAIGLQHAPLEVRESGILWSTPLGAPVERKPDIVRNHVNNTREVLVQDTEHRVHLLGGTGKVLWTRQLDGPIMGAVAQVDRYRNGKLQLLFNTEGRLHLIDRNGKDVAGFPVALKEKASAPMAAFDYDGERDYRVLVPTADGRVLNFGLDGAAVTGWETPRLAAPATNAVRHLRIKSRDHLLIVDGNGKIHLLDRRGVERDRTSLEPGAGAVLRSIAPGLDLPGTRITWSDGDGALHEGALDGTRTTLSPAGSGQAWSADLENDGTPEVLRVTTDSLIVTREGKPVLQRGFPSLLLEEMHLYASGKGAATIGVVRPGAEQVHLLDDRGRDLEGTPFRGAVPCSIADLNLDGGFEVVTVTRDGTVVAYRLPAFTAP